MNVLTLDEYLEDMGEPASSREFLKQRRELIPGYTGPVNPPATDTGD